jgi:hypothetical protein
MLLGLAWIVGAHGGERAKNRARHPLPFGKFYP